MLSCDLSRNIFTSQVLPTGIGWKTQFVLFCMLDDIGKMLELARRTNEKAVSTPAVQCKAGWNDFASGLAVW